MTRRTVKTLAEAVEIEAMALHARIAELEERVSALESIAGTDSHPAPPIERWTATVRWSGYYRQAWDYAVGETGPADHTALAGKSVGDLFDQVLTALTRAHIDEPPEAVLLSAALAAGMPTYLQDLGRWGPWWKGTKVLALNVRGIRGSIISQRWQLAIDFARSP